MIHFSRRARVWFLGRPRPLRTGLSVAVWAVMGVVALIASATWHAQSEFGREAVRSWLEGTINGGIHGKLRIGRILALGRGGVILENVTLRAPSGEEVLRITELRLSPNWRSLYGRHPRILQGIVDGGRMRLHETKDGDLTFLAAVRSRGSSSEPARLPDVVINSVRLNDVYLTIEASGVPKLDVKQINGRARVAIRERVYFWLDHTRGSLELPMLGRVRIQELSGLIRSKMADVVRLSMIMRIGDRALGTNFRYTVPKNDGRLGELQALIHFHTRGVSGATNLLLALKVLSNFSPTFKVTVDTESGPHAATLAAPSLDTSKGER